MMVKRKCLFLSAWLILAMAGPSAHAVDLGFGGEFGLSSRPSDLHAYLGQNPGYGLGLNMLIDFGQGNVLRPRMDAWLSKKSLTVVTTAFITKVRNQAEWESLGLDYLYYLDRNVNNGGYLMLGAGLVAGQIAVELPTATGSWLNASETSTRRYTNLGLGYQWNSVWGIEARYTISRWKDAQELTGNPTMNGNTIALLGTFRF